MSAREIEGRLTSGEWTPIFRGAYLVAGTKITWEARAMAAMLAAGKGAVASYRAAAALHGMPGATRRVELTVPRPRRVRVEGLIVHQARLLLPEDVGEVRGIPVTTPGRTLADLTGIYSKGKLAPMLNYAQATLHVTRAELEARVTGRSHDDVLRQLLDERPDAARPLGSDFEADLFRILREAGLPLPQSQYRVLMPDGIERFVDFAYPEIKLAIEADSYIWHADLAAWQRDRARNSELVVMGWSILPITFDQVRYRKAEVARQVGQALATRLAG